MTDVEPRAASSASAGEQRLRVEVLSMDIECCVPPPAVGDVVSWPLMMFVDRRDGHIRSPDPCRDRRRWRVERWNDATTVLLDGDIQAFWAPHCPPPPSSGTAEVEGCLLAALHYPPVPEGLRSVEGRVSRVWVMSHEYQEVGTGRRRVRVRVPESVTLREVERSPTSFRSDDTGRCVEDALCVELLVADPAGR